MLLFKKYNFQGTERQRWWLVYFQVTVLPFLQVYTIQIFVKYVTVLIKNMPGSQDALCITVNRCSHFWQVKFHTILIQTSHILDQEDGKNTQKILKIVVLWKLCAPQWRPTYWKK